MKAGVALRILFLVDRRVLAAQAVLAFASFDPEPGLKFDKVYEVYSQRFQRGDFDENEKFDPRVLPSSYLTDPQPGHAFVYVSTIQRMTINLFGRDAIMASGDEEVDEDASQLKNIPIHAFDLIIADECHRGYSTQESAIWRKTFDHFDCVKVGLTATPAAHTMAYFKDIVYRYEYERAVREGFLVDYDVIAIKSNVRMNGIFLNEGEQVEVVNPVSGAKQLDLLRIAQPNCNATKLSELQIPIPPSGEQRRLVEAIAASLSKVDAARNHLSRVPAILKRFRQAVLAAACSGRLTEDWREQNPETKPAHLFLKTLLADSAPNKGRHDSETLTSLDELPELPDGWCWVSLNSVTRRIGDVDHKMPKAADQGIPYISTKDFVGENKIDYRGAKQISIDSYQSLCRKIQPDRGDLLLSRYGTTT